MMTGLQAFRDQYQPFSLLAVFDLEQLMNRIWIERITTQPPDCFSRVRNQAATVENLYGLK